MLGIEHRHGHWARQTHVLLLSYTYSHIVCFFCGFLKKKCFVSNTCRQKYIFIQAQRSNIMYSHEENMQIEYIFYTSSNKCTLHNIHEENMQIEVNTHFTQAQSSTYYIIYSHEANEVNCISNMILRICSKYTICQLLILVKKCAKTPFAIPLKLVSHNFNKHLL